LIIREPSYYSAFSCIADRCPDTCCHGWEVVIDEDTCRFYKSLDGEMGEYIRSCLHIDADGDVCMKSENGRCAMLLDSGLCLIQKTYGESALSRVCDRYPRFIHEFGNLTERGVSLSCPVACRLILETPFSLTETTNAEPPSPNDIDPGLYFAFLRGRSIAFRIAADSRFPVFSRAALLLAFAEALQDSVLEADSLLETWSSPDFLSDKLAEIQPKRRANFQILTDVYRSMEPLTERYPAMLQHLDCCPPLPDETMAQRLLQYFLYKYFLQAAYDGKLLKKVQLAAASLLLCGALLASHTPRNRAEEIDLLHLYSREMEHSEVNLEHFFRWAGRRRQKLLTALLLRP